MEENKILWLALNAKYSHTSLSVRYLRQAVPGSEIMELTINHQLLAMLGEIYSARPKVLGISCYIWNIEMVKSLLKLLPAALPDTIIICGGPEVSYGVAEFMQEFPMVDYVCRGEGEEALPKLITQLQAVNFDRSKVNEQLDRSNISGIAWRSLTGQINEGQAVTVADFGECVPFAYRAEEMEDIKERILYYETSRGCPFSCAYCLSCATVGVRFLPLERVFKELAFFVQHDVRQVKFVDRTFNAKKSHFLPILQYLLKLPAGCRTNFHFEVAIDYLDEEVMQVLAQMPKGRVQLEIGIQSTNPATLKAVARVNHWQDIADHIQRIMGFHNMHLHVDLIIGLPGEGMESFHKSFNDVYALQTDMLQLGFLKFLKGAAMMKLIEVYHYQYMPMAPYEVLQNDVLSYEEIRWFHSFEQVFELYYNAGRCRKTANYLIRECEQGDAFVFWQKFTDWWEA
ncbi:MAG: B12-binding domain-containing radical SAM protein, partial [Selenomonas sp.]|nr:B12-binding domain-containing radical SAM protein [Selenomonas sp.]